jgi:hypothetical protein
LHIANPPTDRCQKPYAGVSPLITDFSPRRLPAGYPRSSPQIDLVPGISPIKSAVPRRSVSPLDSLGGSFSRQTPLKYPGLPEKSGEIANTIPNLFVYLLVK